MNSTVSFDYSVTHLGRKRFHGEVNREMGLVYQKSVVAKKDGESVMVHLFLDYSVYMHVKN